MNYIQRLEHWGDAHHPKWLDLLRIALGVFLCIKGVEFLYNPDLMNLAGSRAQFSSFLVILLGHYIVFAHLLGGFLLALGLLTRFACLIQIPILLGAIMFINSSMLRPLSELSLSVLVLMLLVLFLIVGSGPWSVDWAMSKNEKK